MKKFIVIRDYVINELKNKYGALVRVEQDFFRTEIKAYDDVKNIYKNGETLCESPKLFNGETCDIYDDLRLAFENSGVDKSKWNSIDISQLSEEDKALARNIIAAA